MSEPQEQVNRDEVLSIYQADPILGQYVSHHPSNRLRLLLIGGILYAVPVGLLQLIFFNQDTTITAIALPVVFASIAGAILWWMLHHWNREVVLYEKGFSYRQGSATAYILYENVVRLVQNIERISFLGLSRTVYDYHLITNVDEDLLINNVYSNPDKLTRALEAYIARDRMPIMMRQLADGQQVRFANGLHLTQEGIILNDKTLDWQDYRGQRVKNGQLILQSHDAESWGVIAVAEIDNPVLLIALLRARGQTHDATTQE